MKRLVNCLLVSLSLFSWSIAQTTARGRVLSPAGEPIAFASVLLLHLPDSTFLGGTMSDDTGGFVLTLPQAIPYEQLLLKATCIGYQPQVVPAMADSVLITLKEDLQLLGEVHVTARYRNQQIDHRTLSFSPKVRDVAQSAQELLRLVPDLHIDPRSGAISSVSQGRAVVLINGVEATSAQLRSLQAQYIKEVVYYDIPPARYSQAGVVVDIIAPQIENGYNGGANVRGAVNARLADASMYFNAVRGKRQFSLDYAFSHRDNREQVGEYVYTYALQGDARSHSTEVQEASGYTVHTPTLRYVYSDEVQVFQSSLANRFSRTHKDGTSQTLYQSQGSYAPAVGSTWEKTRYWSPLIDTYYSRKLSPQQELSATLKFAHYDTQVDHLNTEQSTTTQTMEVYDKMWLRNKTYSLGGEVVYSYATKVGTWQAGYRLGYTRVNYDLDNIYGHSVYSTTKAEHYGYTELSGKISKLAYKLSLGATYIDEQYATARYHALVLTPRLILSQGLGGGHTLRLQVAYKPQTAIADMVSNNQTYLTRDIIDRGNPLLQRADYYSLRLHYGLRTKHINLSVQPLFDYVRSPFYLDFVYNGQANRYERYMQNAQYQTTSGAAVQIEYKPFGDALSLRAYVLPTYTELYIRSQGYSHFSVWGRFTATFTKGNWLVQYNYGLSDWIQGAGRLVRNFTTHDLYAKYTKGAWGVSLGWSIMGAPARYQMDFLPYSAVAYHSDTRVYDMKNTLTIGIDYTFSQGKKKQVQRKIEGNVSGAVLF